MQKSKRPLPKRPKPKPEPEPYYPLPSELIPYYNIYPIPIS